MTTTFSHFHKAASFGSSRARSPLPSVKTKIVRRPTAPISEMPANLWQHSQNEETAQAHHHDLANRLLLGLAGLSLGEVAHAIYQTCTLMSDNRLRDAVAAFAR